MFLIMGSTPHKLHDIFSRFIAHDTNSGYGQPTCSFSRLLKLLRSSVYQDLGSTALATSLTVLIVASECLNHKKS